MEHQAVLDIGKMQTMLQELVRSKEASEEELKLKRLICMAYIELVQGDQVREQEDDAESKLDALVQYTGTLFANAVALKEEAAKSEFDVVLREIMGALDTARIKRVFEAILRNGMHDNAKFILLLCVISMPQRPGRDALFAAVTTLDLSAVDLKTALIWKMF